MSVPMRARLRGDVLRLDEAREVGLITRRLQEVLRDELHKRGFVVAVSGGIDSSVCAALAVKAVGRKRVFGVLLPERESAPESGIRGRLLCEHLGIRYEVQDISAALAAVGCYEQRDAAIRALFPAYGAGWKSKIAIAGGSKGRFNYFQLVVQSPVGDIHRQRLRLKEYLQIVAATNYKQRIRKAIEYFHADRLNFAVIGTSNRLEFDQGFFVKNGDGSADVKPIAHLYKTQVYALARYLGLPKQICAAVPTTDTYSMPQGQDEFYFSVPYRDMDIALWAYNHHVAAEELAEALAIDPQRAQWLYDDISAKRKTTAYLHRKAILVSSVQEIL